MLTLFIVMIILGIYLVAIQKDLKDADKKEKNWVYLFSAITGAMAILNILPVPIHVPIKWFNHAVGEITKFVIKV
ncbi:hypothetical protein [Robertmurraya andreesenii]|uniref:Uncharacterized protein n=1 Tax=Anoxybacillus andreesenii TaxID=1325932 RepID=A0ABT9V877_9BACL|nr:hypothetical protein [Robertmurraya andreesenii]MDQ0157153.1 hypothetical protein [Robertmurraya andreesenii]